MFLKTVLFRKQSGVLEGPLKAKFVGFTGIS